MVGKHDVNLDKIIRIWLGNFTVIILALLFGLYIYVAKIEPNWIQIVPIDLTIPNLSYAFDNFKIVQISDLHVNRFMPEARLQRIIKLVNQQNPNAIVITGDIITKRSNFDTQKLERNLSQLISQEGTFSILGNHDHWQKRGKRLQQVFRHSNIDNLDNEVYLFRRGTNQLAIAGIDDPYWGKPDMKRVIRELPDNTPAILLVHEPDYVEQSAKTHKFVLQLSGHSHAGQIRIPFAEPLILPYGGKKYYVGLNRVGNMWEYTNRGLGMTGLPYRFGSRPEITVFTLRS